MKGERKPENRRQETGNREGARRFLFHVRSKEIIMAFLKILNQANQNNPQKISADILDTHPIKDSQSMTQWGISQRTTFLRV